MAGGLLDFDFSLTPDQKSGLAQGLLGAIGAGLASRGNTTQALGSGLLGGLSAYQGAQDQALQSQYRQAQAENSRAQAAARQQEAALKQRQADFLSQDPSQWTPQGFAASGFAPDVAQQYLNLGKNKVSKYENVRGADGSVNVVGFDEFGNRVNTGATPFMEPKTLNLGNRYGILDPVTGQVRDGAAIGVSPDAQLSAATARRGQDMTDARSRETNAIGAKPYYTPVQTSSGIYSFNSRTGDYTPFSGAGGSPLLPVGADPSIAGSKAEAAALGKAAGESKASLPKDLANSENVLNTIDTVLNHPALDKSVGVFSALPVLPGTPQANFQAARQQLDGQAFLQAFESLKGGGAITEIEGQKATQAIGRLNTTQSPTEYKASLQELRGVVNRARDRMIKNAGSAPAQNTQQADPLGIRR